MTSRRLTRPVDDRDLSALDGRRLVLWRQGNLPDQQIHALTEATISRHLCALYLLADSVLASASFYFESPMTRLVTRRLRELFESGRVLYFVDDAKESFAEHAEEKRVKSPLHMTCYQDAIALTRRASEMASLGHLVRRPARSISDEIAGLWRADVASVEAGTIGRCLVQLFPANDQRLEWTAILVGLADRHGPLDFVWEYLEPQLLQHRAPERLRRTARRRLASFYTTATAKVLGVELSGDALRAFDSKLDSGLFLECIGLLGVAEHFDRLSVAELIALKESQEWMNFRTFYWTLLDGGATDSRSLAEALPLYVQAEERFQAGADVPSIHHIFGILRGIVAPRIDLAGRPLDVLLALCRLFEGGAIAGFRKRLSQYAPAPSVTEADSVIELRTVVSVDLVRYSSILRPLEQSLGQDAAAKLNAQVRGFISDALAPIDVGSYAVLADTGDGALIGFPVADVAHRFVDRLNVLSREHNASRSEQSACRAFRSGAASGPIVIERDNDGHLRVAGDAIVRAVRLQAAAGPGEFVVERATFRELPESVQALYGKEETVPGKRDESFVAHRCGFYREAASAVGCNVVLPTKALSTPKAETVGTGTVPILELARRVPREHVEFLMIMLQIPPELWPPPTLNPLERLGRVAEWAEREGKAPDLYDALLAYSPRT